MKIFVSVLLTVFVFAGLSKKEKQDYQWFKGNTHCHSTVSDGDNPPHKVVKAYHDQGYNFMLLTDHNILVDMDTVLKPENMRKDFIIIPGEEVTDQKSVHTTAFNISGYVPFSNDPNQETVIEKRREEIVTALHTPVKFSKTELLQMHVDGIQEKGGICFLNHPNFSGGLQVDDIYPVENLTHIELYNGHPSVANWGKEGHIPVEAKWDSLLSRGRVIYGVAADDMHNLTRDTPKKASLFKGWIMVKSNGLTIEKIHDAVANGDFYASNSVILKTCDMGKKKCKIEVDKDKTQKEITESCGVPRMDKTGSEGYTIEFIGKGGAVLKSVKGLKGTYKPKAKDNYVRARITHCTKTDEGFAKLFAWTQPVFL